MAHGHQWAPAHDPSGIPWHPQVPFPGPQVWGYQPPMQGYDVPHQPLPAQHWGEQPQVPPQVDDDAGGHQERGTGQRGHAERGKHQDRQASRQTYGNNQDDKKEDSTSTAVYCKQCQAWLNGPRQWEDHKIGKKHRKNVQKEKAAATTSGSAGAATAKAPAQIVLEEPEKKTEMWQWLEDGRKDKIEEKKARRRRSHKNKEAEEGEGVAEVTQKTPDAVEPEGPQIPVVAEVRITATC